MIQRGKNFGFSLEAGKRVVIGGECVRKHLDGNGPLQVRVGRPIHFAHSAAPIAATISYAPSLVPGLRTTRLPRKYTHQGERANSE
jgi:hypothetical protein